MGIQTWLLGENYTAVILYAMSAEPCLPARLKAGEHDMHLFNFRGGTYNANPYALLEPLMSFSSDDVKKIAHLARLNMSDEDIGFYTPQLSNILHFVEQMNAVDTSHIEPLANPLDQPLRLRLDVITEKNERDAFQAIAPKVEAGLYLVPKVIEGE